MGVADGRGQLRMNCTSGCLQVSSSELNLKLTLESGQAFLWRPTGDEKWTGPIGSRLIKLYFNLNMLM